MDLQDKLGRIFNQELIKRLLVKYFHEKGFSENFDKKVYPPLMQDIPEVIPELGGKIEVEPYAIDVDPTNGQAKLGWNLFVLGNQRMYLGETFHTELQNLAEQIENKSIAIDENAELSSKTTRTARDIVGFISRVLGTKESGLINMNNTSDRMQHELSPLGHYQHTDFFDRPKPIRPEGSQQF